MPAILWTTNSQLHITSTVGAGLATLNVKPAEIIGMSMSETLGRSDPDTTPVSAHARALRGESLIHEMQWRGRTFQVRVEPLRNPERRITGTIGVVLDVTDQKQTIAELKARVRQQAAVAALGQQALAGGDLDSLLASAVRAVRETLGVELCELLEPANGGQLLRLRAGSGWWRGGRDVIDAGALSPAAVALESCTPLNVENLAADARFAKDPLARCHGVVSSLSIPIQARTGPCGVLSAHATRPRPFSEDDCNFLQAAAHIIAAALDRKEAEGTQNRLVALLEATTDGVAIADADRRLLYVNRAGRAMFGVDANDNPLAIRLDDFYAAELRGRFVTEVIPAALRKGAGAARWTSPAAPDRRGPSRRSCWRIVHRKGRWSFSRRWRATWGNGGGWRTSCGRRKRWKRSAGSRAASRTISTTCCASSPATARWR